MQTVQFTPKFVNTRNNNSLETMMDGLMLFRSGRQDGDERLGCIWGQAGRGKTRGVQHWVANNDAVYLETTVVDSELDFLQSLCLELGIRNPSGRRKKAFSDAKDAIIISRKVVFVDEPERFGQRLLEVVRDLAKLSGGIFVLVGEEELPQLMRQNRRVWSRTFREMEFQPASAADVVTYVNQTTGLKLTPEAMSVMHKASGGDIRVIKRDTINLVHVVNSMDRQGDVSAETATIACQSGMQGASSAAPAGRGGRK